MVGKNVGDGTGVNVGIGVLVAMTAMPEMVALFNGFGGIASLLVGWAVYHIDRDLTTYKTVTIMLSVFIGGITFSGSFIAFAKLSGLISGKPVLYRGQQIVNVLILAAIIAASVPAPQNMLSRAVSPTDIPKISAP